MTEARRHSVDIPLSRTLVALRRVRSLRDPDTSSLSKIAALVDNMNLEASSCGSSATFGSSNNKHDLRHKGSYHWERRRMVDLGMDSDSDNNCLAPDSHNAKSASAKRSANETRVQESCGDHMNRSYDSKCVHRCTSQLEKEVDSQHGREFEQFEMIGFSSLKQTRHDALRRSYTSKGDVFMRNPGIPWACANETCTSALGHKLLGPATKNVELVLPNNNGCQVSCCWSRVPKFHYLELPSDVEGQEFQLNSQINKELDHHVSASYHDSSMNLSEKYRPKSFHELVGQSEVAQSLLDTILKGKIAPIYLFHGPRGTGKTSAARIFAAALNCQSCKEQWPCGCCQECVHVFSGRSRDVTELDASETNHKDALKVLSESALVPTSSCYKIFIIDECQLLQRNIWSAIYKSIKDLSRQVVFIMITSDQDKLPNGTLAWCQGYHFLNVKSDDIVGRLKKICLEEKLEFEEDALIFLATESNGSLRDAITTLDQLALLGKGITTSLAYELMGIISNDELLDLLHLALSSDTSGTVRRARELISSGIDPMQLTSQLAKLIMDILSGGCQLEPSRFIAEAGKEKLKHGLKILVETEKQLRTSRDQSTWLTAALLQFNTGESLPPTNMNPLEAPEKVSYSRDDGPPAVASPKESLKSAIHVRNHRISSSESHYDAARELEDIWRRTIENCQSSSLKRFLWKEGRLSSVHLCEGLAIAELEFCHPDHVSRAEESWELIIGSLQTIVGCKVDIKISLVPINRAAKKKSSISLFCCTGRKQQTSDLTVTNKKDSLLPGTKEETIEFCSSHHKEDLCVKQQLHFNNLYGSNSFDQKVVNTNASNGCALVTGNTMISRTVQDGLSKECKEETDPSKEVCEGGQYMNIQGTEDQPSCLCWTLKFSRRSFSANAARATTLRIKQLDKPNLFNSQKSSSEENICTDDPHLFCSDTNEQDTYNTEEDKGPSTGSSLCSRLYCCRASMPVEKVGPKGQQDDPRPRLVGWTWPCASSEQASHETTTAEQHSPALKHEAKRRR
ncbi:DNA polymerase III subunits gamma and tau domain III [Musa troglodytarum]|uniref:DNA polymerase III subunits gamma and tau domain III n=1 Tax=Musa troglodytarum TaxID=320322 RepID=A0A9E7I8X3_9LILI|nr:DNA polymerase III subunits gamma and tau domain III [Musa troglodytarum]